MPLGLHIKKYSDSLEGKFYYFIEEVWKVKGYSTYHPIGRIERDVCDWFQYGPAHQGSLLHRGWGKTYLIVAGGICWDLLRDPNWKEFIVSKSTGQARKTIHLIRDWIETVPFLQHLSPSARKPRNEDGSTNRPARDGALGFDVGPTTHETAPSVSAMGIEGQLPGTRAHRIMADDVETNENTKTQESREDLAMKVAEFTAIASYGERRINIVGTLHHEESVYVKLEDERGYTFRTWPLLYPEKEDRIIGLAPMIKDELNNGAVTGDQVDPAYPTAERVIELQSEGASWFAMQCQLIANLGDTLRYPLRLSDFTVFNLQRDKAPVSVHWGKTNNHGQSTKIRDIKSLGFKSDCFHGPVQFDSTWKNYNGTKMWIDTSGAGEDETSYAVVSYGSGLLWCKAVGGLAGEKGQSGYSPASMDALALAAREHNVKEIFVEENFGQGMFLQLFEPVLARHFLRRGVVPEYPDGWRCSLEGIRVTGQKELRIISSLEPVMNQHRLVIDYSVAADEVLQRQITRLTRQRNCLPHDDRVEALAMAVKMWEDVLNRDPDLAAKADRAAYIDEALQEHYKLLALATGNEGGKEPGWIAY